jgi:hypothetical protein
MVWINLYHGKLPQTRSDDPSGGKAVGYMFIPFYSYYWLFFTHMRLQERVDEALVAQGLAPTEMRDLVIAVCAGSAIPYFGLFAWFTVYPVMAGMLQARINELAVTPVEPSKNIVSVSLPIGCCQSCGRQNSLEMTFCTACGNRLPEDLDQAPRAEFHGTGLQYLGWSLLTCLLLYLIIPAIWGIQMLWRWFVSKVRLNDGKQPVYTGNITHLWWAGCLYGLLACAAFIQVVIKDDTLRVVARYIIPLLLLPGTAALQLVILKELAANTELPSGEHLVFKGAYGQLLGFTYVVFISVFTVVGWAWAIESMMRWYCLNTQTRENRLEFTGRGHELLWRGLVAYTACIPLFSSPWAISWFMKWFIKCIKVVPVSTPGSYMPQM